VDKDVGVFATRELGPEFVRIRGVGNDHAIRLVRETAGRFFRGNQRGDFTSGFRKKIRASFTGVTTTGEEDARS
jgi:hypothetical protein